RPSAKELLKDRFIRNARKSPKLLERLRERPKYQVKEDLETARNGLRGVGEGSDTMKVARDSKVDEINRSSSRQSKTSKSSEWDFSIGESEGTGTFRSVSRPPQARDKKTEGSYNQLTQRKAPDAGYQGGYANRSAPYHHEQLDNQLEDDELSGNGSGTVVIRSPKGISRTSAFREHISHSQDDLSENGSGTVVIRSPKGSKPSVFRESSQSSSSYASFEDTSTSGTVVLRSQQDDSDSPRTPRSRLGGLHDRNSNVSLEDSAANLAEAKAAIQGGQRKVNSRERHSRGKINSDNIQESKRDQMTSSTDSSRSYREYIDAQRGMARSNYASDDEESARIISSSAPLSVLLLPSLKEAIADDPEGQIVRAVINSLINMEGTKPRSSDVLVKKLLQRLASSKEDSLKDLQGLASQLFSKGKSTEEIQNAEADNRRKQHNKEPHPNSNLSPLARFLLSRWQGQTSRDLNQS
ncbi:MAP kinase, partial [Trifolium pratense]